MRDKNVRIETSYKIERRDADSKPDRFENPQSKNCLQKNLPFCADIFT